jgi:hypothetical protein
LRGTGGAFGIKVGLERNALGACTVIIRQVGANNGKIMFTDSAVIGLVLKINALSDVLAIYCHNKPPGGTLL